MLKANLPLSNCSISNENEVISVSKVFAHTITYFKIADKLNIFKLFPILQQAAQEVTMSLVLLVFLFVCHLIFLDVQTVVQCPCIATLGRGHRRH